MLLHGVFADAQRGGDFLVGVALGDECEDFTFARGDLGFAEAVQEALLDFGRQAAFPLRDGADGGEEGLAGGGFLEIAERSGFSAA